MEVRNNNECFNDIPFKTYGAYIFLCICVLQAYSSCLLLLFFSSLYHSLVFIAFTHTRSTKHESRIAFQTILWWWWVEEQNPLPQIIYLSLSISLCVSLAITLYDKHNKVNAMEMLKQFQKWNPLWNHSSEFIHYIVVTVTSTAAFSRQLDTLGLECTACITHSHGPINRWHSEARDKISNGASIELIRERQTLGLCLTLLTHPTINRSAPHFTTASSYTPLESSNRRHVRLTLITFITFSLNTISSNQTNWFVFRFLTILPVCFADDFEVELDRIGMPDMLERTVWKLMTEMQHINSIGVSMLRWRVTNIRHTVHSSTNNDNFVQMGLAVCCA